jgi:K+-sensing histidine kinase KdpD
LGGKETGRRIYNKYQVPSRNPIAKSVKKTGRDNLGFQSDAQVGRYSRHGAKFHTHTQLGRLDNTRANKANTNNKKSTAGSSLVPNSNRFNKAIEPGEIKVHVIGINTKDSADVKHDHNRRKYSAATTVSLSALSPDYCATVSKQTLCAYN